MAVLSKQDIMNKLKDIVGDNTDDTALTFIEDVSDTFDNLSNKDQEDWKTKYEENDKAWREKYRDRFFNGGASDDKPESEIDEEPEEKKPLTFDQLFKEG